MKSQFDVKLLEFKTIQELPDAWSLNNYKELLDIMDYGDTSEILEDDLKDMFLMLLSDSEPEEAVLILLNYVFGERLTSGQKQNLSNEMLDENMWEEYSDLSMHEAFFNIHQVLYKAYNGKFPHPEAVRFVIEISHEGNSDFDIFKNETEAKVLRIIAKGMPKNTLINRLFDDQLVDGEFNEAKDIIWQIERNISSPKISVFTVISSPYWFKDLKYVGDFNAEINVSNMTI